MAYYSDENEQIEVLKKWWQDNGKKILIITVVGIVFLLGYSALNSKKLEYTQQAGTLYESLLVALYNNQPITKFTTELKTNYADSVYAQLAALQAASSAVDHGDLKRAEEELRWAAEHKNDEYTYILADLRLARVKFALGDFDATAEIIARQKTDLYAVQFKELLGDVLLKQNKLKEARAAYTAAQKLAEENGQITPILRMKLNDIAM